MDPEPRSDEHAMARVCGELNFRHSLVSEGNEMRALALGAIARSAVVLDRVASSQRRLADDRSGSVQQARLRTCADQAGAGAARARQLHATLEARPIEQRRPSTG